MLLERIYTCCVVRALRSCAGASKASNVKGSGSIVTRDFKILNAQIWIYIYAFVTYKEAV